MNMSFNTGAWFANRKKYNFKTFNIEGVEFDLMPLTEVLIEQVKSLATYSEMILAAADFGLSSGRDRICDDEEMRADIDCVWALEQLDIDCEPSIQHRVGEKVCAISGLTEFTEAKKLEEEELIQMEKEEAAAAEVDAEIEALNGDQVVCGDNLSPEQLRADAAAFQAA